MIIQFCRSHYRGKIVATSNITDKNTVQKLSRFHSNQLEHIGISPFSLVQDADSLRRLIDWFVLMACQVMPKESCSLYIHAYIFCIVVS